MSTGNEPQLSGQHNNEPRLSIQTMINHARTTRDHANIYVRLRAVVILAAAGEEDAFTALVQMLEHNDPHVQSRAAMALGRLRDERAIEPLIDCVLAARHQHVEEATFDALRRLDHDAVQQALTTRMQTGDLLMQLFIRVVMRRVRGGYSGNAPLSIGAITRGLE